MKEKLWAKFNGTYYFVSSDGDVSSSEWEGVSLDYSHFEYGNFFISRGEAEVASKRVKKALKGNLQMGKISTGMIAGAFLTVAIAISLVVFMGLGTANRAKKTLVSKCLESGNAPLLTETEFTCKFKEGGK